MPADHERAFEFQQGVLARTSTRTRALPWGTAYFHDEFPLRYDANMAIADRPLGTASASEVAAALDEVYAGYRHREVEFASTSDADSIAMGMGEHGYAVEPMVVMAHRRDPDRAPVLEATEELGFDEIRSFVVEVTRREPWGRKPGIADMLASFRQVLVDGVGARFFAQTVDGQIAGLCELYVEGDTAQIESVDTLEEFRGRGVARNVVLRAAAEARNAGATFVFLFADAQDWPRYLYARLGFDDVGGSTLFTRWPDNPAAGRSKSPNAV